MRLLHRVYALLAGYFWLPCPRCGAEFGGHEVQTPEFSYRRADEPDPYRDRVLCPPCTRVESREAYARAVADRAGSDRPEEQT